MLKSSIALSLIGLTVMAPSIAGADVFRYQYSGTIQAILDGDGNTGGAFNAAGGPSLGDTFVGTFSFDTNNAVPGGTPFPGVVEYDFRFGTVFPSLTFNGVDSVDLAPKTGVSVVNDGTGLGSASSIFGGAINQMGFDPLPDPIDAVLLFTDEQGFDGNTSTGFEVIVFSFDASATALNDTALPNPLSVLDNAFFLFQEQVNGEDQAAAFGAITEVVVLDEPDGTPSNPLLPTETTPEDYVFSFTPEDNTEPTFIDPDIATGYEFRVEAGPNVASVIVPSALPNGDGTFIIDLGLAGTFPLLAGVEFDLLAIDSNGFSSFSILDISVDENLDPDDPLAFRTGLTFVDTGDVTVTQSPLLTFVGDVPEPGTLSLFGLGLVGLGVWRRRRSLQA